MANGNGKAGKEVEKQAAIERAYTVLAAGKRPDSPIRNSENDKVGVLSTYQKAVKTDNDIVQELKQCIWESYEQMDYVNAALDELELMGLPLTPVLRRLASISAGVRGERMQAILKAYSHITIGDDGDQGHNVKKRFWQRSGNGGSDHPLSQ
jgi:hypothetical protein